MLDEMNLEIKKGEYFVMLGPTGSGKTTLLKCIAGLYRPAKGEIWINGTDVSSLPPEKREIGYVPQDYKLFPHLKVEENIAFGLKNKDSVGQEEEVNRLIEFVGLSHLSKRCIKCLSGGERQRVALARALAIQPKLLLLDEPLGVLDARMKEKLQMKLKRIHKQTEKTTIHVTHDFVESLDLADRMGIMMDGKIVQVGTPNEIIRKPDSVFVAEFVGIKNLFKGKVLSNKDERTMIDLGIVDVFAHTEKTGGVYVSFRPEDVLLSRNEPKVATKNIFDGTITDISKRGYLAHVEVDIGIPINVLATQSSTKGLGLVTGSKVYVSIEEADMHVFSQ